MAKVVYSKRTATDSTLNTNNVSIVFNGKQGEFKALDNITLEIPDGSAYGFLGSNGAGKSTLMRMMTNQKSICTCIFLFIAA